MSILQNIRTSRCPICGSGVIINETIDIGIGKNEILKHCNGGRWETRTFLCGMIIKYIPNFSKEQYDEMSCRDNHKLIELKQTKTKMLEETESFINSLNQDEDFKKVLLERIEYAKYNI